MTATATESQSRATRLAQLFCFRSASCGRTQAAVSQPSGSWDEQQGPLPHEEVAVVVAEEDGVTPRARVTAVSEALFIGTLLSEQNLPELKAKGITHVLQVGNELEPSHPEDFEYLSVSLKDNESQDILRVLRPCLRWIHDACKGGGKVLVHCMAGASRSPSVCCAYLMWTSCVGVTAALATVSQAHAHTQPNPRFLAALQEFETEMGCRLEALPDTPLHAIRNSDAPPSSLEADSDDDGNLGLTQDDWA